MVVLIVLCLGFLIFMLFAPYVCVPLLVKFWYLSGHLLESSCSFGLRGVFMV